VGANVVGANVVGANVVGTIVGFGLELGTEDSAVVVVTGEMVGSSVGSFVGEWDGSRVGFADGDGVGGRVGASGLMVTPNCGAFVSN
jgi:hypothetical protein